VKAQPGVFRLRARFKNLTIDAPFTAPLTVTLTHGSGPTTRAGQVSDCQATNAGIKCRPFWPSTCNGSSSMHAMRSRIR
jgi:hypothetical protein